MKVYYRFAPPNAPTAEIRRDDSDPPDSRADSLPPPPMLQISLRDVAQRRGEASLTSLTVAEPITGSTVSFVCCRAFLPGCVSIAPQRQQARQQSDVFNEVVRPRIGELLSGRRCAFLAYGQTATGKTYTIFGPDGSFPRACGAKEEEEEEEEGRENDKEEEMKAGTAGLVPRLLCDLFAAPGMSAGSIDISCVEVYNECATDLVALQLQKQQQQQQQQQQQPPQSSRRRNGAKQTEPNDYDMNTTTAAAAWLAWAREERNNLPTLPDFSALRATYRSTEKSLVMRSALRLRAASATACWGLLRGLLALRQCSQTERNVRSSRSHLLLRLELRGAGPRGAPLRLGEALFADLAGSESYRDHAWGPSRHSMHSNSNSNSNSRGLYGVGGSHNAVAGQDAVRQPRGGSIAASTFAANLCDGSGLTAAQRTALKTNEMRHINSSLLALRKVLRSLRTATASASSAAPPLTFSSLSSSSSFSSSSSSSPAASTGAAAAVGVSHSPVLVTTHIPFRDSTLTTILEPFLVPEGAESAVAWIVCCSMKQRDFHETVESLRFGTDASAIPARVQISQTSLTRAEDTFGGSRNTQLPQSRPLNTNTNTNINTNAEATANATATGVLSGPVVHRGSMSGLSAANGGDHDGDLRKELEAYKRYAQQLLDQCNGLCESYNECVEELFRTKDALAARDREIAQLRLAQSNPSLLSLEPSKEIREESREDTTPPPLSPEEEALRLVESILRRHCVQHSAERPPLADLHRNTRRDTDSASRRQRTVSFVSPCIQGAVPLAGAGAQSVLVNAPSASVLCTTQGIEGTANALETVYRI